MKNAKIGEMLKHYRKQNDLTVSDVALQLRNNYQIHVSEKTIYGWESNQAHPTTDTFVLLCELYKINNLNEALGKSSPKSQYFHITADERALINEYRKQPELQPIIKRILNMEDEEEEHQS